MFFMKTKKRLEKVEEELVELKESNQRVSDDLVNLEEVFNKNVKLIRQDFVSEKQYIEDYYDKIEKAIKSIIVPASQYVGVQKAEVETIVHLSQIEMEKRIQELEKKEKELIDETSMLLWGKLVQLYDQKSIPIQSILDNQRRMMTDIANINASFSQLGQLVSTILEMKKELDEEKKTNAQLIDCVKNQNAVIGELGKKVDSLSAVITANKVIQPPIAPVELGTRLQTAIPESPKKSPVPTTKPNLPLLTNSKPHNLKVLSDLLNGIDGLEKEYTEILGTNPSNKIYFKILGSYKEQLEELIEQVEKDNDLEVSDIAEKLKKIIETSLAKNFANSSLVSVIDKYLIGCKLAKHEIPLHQKLSDEMLEFIGQPLVKKVDNAELNNMLLGKKHDAYYILYKDESGLQKKIITGECEVGKYS